MMQKKAVLKKRAAAQGDFPLTTRVPNARLRAAREARGWSQSYVAERIGTVDRTILRWESGASRPHLYHVQRLCELFGTKARELGLEQLSPDETIFSQFPLLVPELPADIIGRESDLEAVRLRLLRDESMAVVGIGGVGKTTLALMLAHHQALQEHYPDGILWGAPGPGGNSQEIVSSWGQVLGYSPKQMASTSGEKSRGLLRAAIGNRAMLLILDDVRDEQIALTLREIAGPRCRWLYTSRSRKVAQDLVGGQRTYMLGEITV